jgi:hypothetical protein
MQRNTVMQKTSTSTKSDNICCNSMLCELQDYMFFKQTIDDACKYMNRSDSRLPRNANNANNANNTNKRKQHDSLYKPHQKDSLFWCYYVLVHGLATYETIGNKHFTVEKNEKFKLVELVRNKKLLLKNHKMTPLSSIESDLTNGDAISLTTFFAICIASNISVLYIDKVNNTFLRVSGEEGVDECATVNVVYRSDTSQRFECETGVDPCTVNAIEKTHFKLFSMNKPIQSLSSYKTTELLEICTKVGIHIYLEGDAGKTHAKPHLYNALKLKLEN